MKKGPRTTPELIGAVRRCADAKMSAAQTADELSTRDHPLSRNAVIGIAHRNGVKFNGKRPKRERAVRAINPRRAVRKSTVRRTAPYTSAVSVLTGAQVRAKTKLKPPGARCSWAGCTRNAEPDDMFCYGHGRRALLSSNGLQPR